MDIRFRLVTGLNILALATERVQVVVVSCIVQFIIIWVHKTKSSGILLIAGEILVRMLLRLVCVDLVPDCSSLSAYLQSQLGHFLRMSTLFGLVAGVVGLSALSLVEGDGLARVVPAATTTLGCQSFIILSHHVLRKLYGKNQHFDTTSINAAAAYTIFWLRVSKWVPFPIKLLTDCVFFMNVKGRLRALTKNVIMLYPIFCLFTTAVFSDSAQGTLAVRDLVISQVFYILCLSISEFEASLTEESPMTLVTEILEDEHQMLPKA